MMSSICLAMTSVSFGVSAEAGAVAKLAASASAPTVSSEIRFMLSLLALGFLSSLPVFLLSASCSVFRRSSRGGPAGHGSARPGASQANLLEDRGFRPAAGAYIGRRALSAWVMV